MSKQITLGPQLPAKVPLERDDSLDGYLYAVADAYFYPSPQVLLSAAGINRPLSQNLHRLDSVAAMLKVPLEELQRRAYRLTGGREKDFLGFRISNRNLVASETRICPECLRDGRRHSALFDLIWNVACDHHGARLIGRCPDCGRELGWGRPRLDRCYCGLDLRTVPVTRASQESVHYSRLLRRAAGLLSDDHGPRRDHNPFAWDWSIYDANLATLLDMLAIVIHHDPRWIGDRSKPYRLRTDEVRAWFDDTAVEFFNLWPDGALRLLQRWRNARISAFGGASNSLSRRYSLSLEYMRRSFRHGVPPMLLEVRNRHLEQHTFSLRLQYQLAKPTWITVNSAAKLLGKSPRHILDLCDQGQLVSRPVSEGIRKCRAIEQASVARHQAFRTDYITQHEVMRRYGLSRCVIDGLCRLNIITNARESEEPKLSYMEFDPGRIDRLFEHMHRLAKTISTNEIGERHRRLVTLARTQKAAETIVCILAGKLRCFVLAGQPKDRLDSYYFSHAEAKVVRRLIDARETGLGLWEAARFLDCPPGCLRYLVANRIFVPQALEHYDPETFLRRGCRSLRFMPADLLRFQREWVSMNEIRIVNGSGRRAGPCLRRIYYNLKPAIPRGAFSTRQFLWYRRSEVSQFLQRENVKEPVIRSVPEFVEWLNTAHRVLGIDQRRAPRRRKSLTTRRPLTQTGQMSPEDRS